MPTEIKENIVFTILFAAFFITLWGGLTLI